MKPGAYIQDAAAQPNIKTIIVALDAFTSGNAAQPFGGGFDELRLAVTPQGMPTPRRNLWLFTSRYLSGGALGMHALGVWLLAQLGPGQLAAGRPDVFTEYGHMTPAKFQHELTRRAERTMRLTDWQRSELQKSLDAVCESKAAVYFYFPPDNMAIISHYLSNDRQRLRGLQANRSRRCGAAQRKLCQQGSPVRFHEREQNHAGRCRRERQKKPLLPRPNPHPPTDGPAIAQANASWQR